METADSSSQSATHRDSGLRSLPVILRGVFLIMFMSTIVACGPPPRHNVVLVTFDTTRADHFGCYGNDEIDTPVVDGLAAEGILFRHAFSAVPVTAPSHSTILTGRYPPAHGVRDNGLFVLTESQTTLAEILKEQGYATAAAVGSFPLDSQFGLDQGFDFYDDHFTGSYEDFRGQRVRPKAGLFFDERKAALVNEAIFPWIEEHHEQPFFIWLHYFDPHHPQEPPTPYDQLYSNDPYKGEIAYADESLGVLVEKLRRLGVWDDTLLVFTSDHGEGLGEHNEMTHSTLAYNSTLHVPLVVRVPGGPQGKVVEPRVGTVDIVPTILDLLGISPASEIQGQSMVSLINGEGSSEFPRTQYAETLAPRFSHSLGELRVLFHRQFKYIFGPRPELYDLAADPGETSNLMESEGEVADALHQRLDSFLAEHAAQDPATVLDVDEEVRARLEALGYIHTSGGQTTVREELDGSGTAPQDRVADVNDISTAKHFLNKNNPTAAKEIALKLLRRDADNPYYLQLKATAELRLEQLEEALATMAEIRRHDPNGLPAEPLLLQVVTNLYYSGRGQEAVDLLADAQEAKPTALGQWYLASLYGAGGAPDREVAALQRALELTPEFAPARIDLAAKHAVEGDLATARREFERALQDLPYYPKAHFNYATLLRQTGEMESAIQHFARAVQLDPNYLRAHYALVVTALEAERHTEAEGYLAALTAISPDSPEAKQAQVLVEGASS